MARTFLLSALVTRVRERSDLENSLHVTSSELKGYLSTAYAQLYSFLVAAGLRHYESEQTINTTGVASYALPSDHLSTVGVDYQDASGRREALFELMVQERNAWTGSSVGRAEAYSVVAANVVLYGTPPSGQTYKHVYVPQPADLSAAADATSVDVVTPDGEDYLIWRAACMALYKEESLEQAAMCDAKAQQAQARAEQWAVMRYLNAPRRVVINEGPSDWDPGDWRWR